jgi:hypothetical protein
MLLAPPLSIRGCNGQTHEKAVIAKKSLDKGAVISTTRVNPNWEWPLLAVWGGGSGLFFELTHLGVWKGGLVGALLAGLLVWFSHIMFCQPRRG